jgi:hypothetical protein
MNNSRNKFIQLILHPVKFRLFLFAKLPSAFFSGLRVQVLDTSKAEVTVPYKWFSKNPFKSTYFACLAMAAELSTGLLAMMNTYQVDPPISMLVTGLEAKYFKKATGKTTFLCEEGDSFHRTVLEAISSGEGRVLTAKSAGRNEVGEIVAEFLITWSFKVKK